MNYSETKTGHLKRMYSSSFLMVKSLNSLLPGLNRRSSTVRNVCSLTAFVMPIQHWGAGLNLHLKYLKQQKQMLYKLDFWMKSVTKSYWQIVELCEKLSGLCPWYYPCSGDLNISMKKNLTILSLDRIRNTTNLQKIPPCIHSWMRWDYWEQNSGSLMKMQLNSMWAPVHLSSPTMTTGWHFCLLIMHTVWIFIWDILDTWTKLWL